MRAVSRAGALGKVADPSVNRSDGLDRAWSMDAVAVGQAVIAGMRRTTGSGAPDRGGAFGHAARGFASVSDTVRSAHPHGDWHGAAALGYAQLNASQAIRAGSMAALDRSVEAVIAREADQVTFRRERLDHHAGQLSEIARAARSLAQVPGVGPAMQRAVEWAAVHSAVDGAGDELRVLSGETARNAAALHGLAVQYASVAEADAVAGDGPAMRARHDESRRDGATDGGHVPDDSGEPAPAEEVPPTALPSPVHRTDPISTGVPQDPPAPAPSPGPAADPLAGIAPSLGMIGGLIGAMVSPLAAVVTGAVGAAAQSASAGPTTRATDSVAEPEDPQPRSGVDERRDDPSSPRSTDVLADGGGAHELSAGPAAPVPAPQDSAATEPSPPVTVDPAPPTAPPAATRPPR